MLRAISYWVREHAHCPKTNLHIRINAGLSQLQYMSGFCAMDIFNKSRTYTDAFASAVTGSMRRICLFLETVCRNKFWLDTGQVGAGKVGPWQAWDEQAGAGQVDAGATAGRQGVDSRVEWFSIILRFSKSYTFLLIRYICRRSIPQHRRISQQSFHCQKIAGTLNMNIFSWKFAESFLIHKRTIAKKKIWN